MRAKGTTSPWGLVQAVEHVDTYAEEPPSITVDPTERRGEPASDHLPVAARFRLE